ncbi:BrnT family toxin [Rhizobium sp. S-51]|uniref:BrnT family toxin n=1 Tax=Rhizobium terricola TaxID=2728849 RepID=A0A7Y0FUR2_9HYPH|nr:BrnT family toxin [Rhizobium terricola]
MFEWDDAKDASNIAKHGIGFATAIRIFDGPVVTAIDDRFDYGEMRHNSVGMIESLVCIVVTHTDRNGVTRIISARPAKRRERERYAETLRQRTHP